MRPADDELAPALESKSEGASAELPTSWKVDLPEFEGPLDLLLHLVRINEVEITEIPVATICDQFHETLRLMEVLNLDVAAEYIYEAAQLIYLKSRMLLPRASQSEEGEDDPRQELVERLLEYQKMKEAAQSFAEIHSLRSGIWSRELRSWEDEESDEAGVELDEVSLYDLLSALKDVLDRYEYRHPDPLLLKAETYSVRDQFERLLDHLDPERAYDLLTDLRERESRGEVVAAFLAVLELTRLNLVRLHQTDKGEILLLRTGRHLAVADLEEIRS